MRSVVPPDEQQAWSEENTYTIEVMADDPDGNDITVTIDPEYPLPDWASFDTDNYILVATPPTGSLSEDVGYGEGVYRFGFIAEDNGNPAKTTKKMIEALIQSPFVIIDDFEYLDLPESDRTLAYKNWYKLLGSGSMSRVQ